MKGVDKLVDKMFKIIFLFKIKTTPKEIEGCCFLWTLARDVQLKKCCKIEATASLV